MYKTIEIKDIYGDTIFTLANFDDSTGSPDLIKWDLIPRCLSRAYLY